ncbi:acetylcholinesterase [Rhipicephalus sanguineus]|uniref:acetylcholinesterase n=1 Tax=Rhipicephalus sanguineus TaxID=34632 RepID=UPI0020C25C52|nr:acetylcholinesterase [Rhipicephalus sanguineus]
MEVTDSSKGDDRAATREPHVRTLRVHSDRTATGSGTASSRLGHRRGSRIGSPAVRADSLATREAQAHRDDAQEPLERAEKVCQLTYAGLFALFLTLFAYFLVNALSTGTIVRVRTEMGLVSGELRRVMENNVFHYLGLPYASKPARFQRAGPADRLRLNHIVPQFPGVRVGFGQGGADWYNGALLSSLGGVVIVAPNFRLGPLAVPLKEDQPQEVPLLSLSDQMLAIKWTWHNIKYFGGNTSEISLLGAGGGAWTVGEMVLSNRENVRDIIKRVLLHGGSPLQRYAPFRAYLVEKALGCGPASGECLDMADASKLFDLASQRLLGPPATLLAAEPKQHDGIDILEDTLTRLQEYFNFTGLAAIFDKLRRDTVQSSDIWPRFLEDLLIRCPIEQLGDLYRVMHATIYGFVYDDDDPYPSDVVEMPFPDLDMLFGVPLISSDPPYPERMKETSLQYMKVWSTFIKKGRLPNVNGNPWPVMIEDSRWTAISVIIKDGMKLSAPTRFVHKTCEQIDALLQQSIRHPDSDSSEFGTEGHDR